MKYSNVLERLTQKNKPYQKKLNGGINGVMRELKKVYVQGILDAAAKQKK